MKIIVTLLLAASFITGCVKCKEHNPGCLNQSVEEFKNSDSICDDGASVKEYYFQGKLVYVFVRGNCIADDQYKVQDAQCNYLGSLGGIAGNSVINGADFGTAVYQRTVWSN
jgi:uncharacterized protein DUF6970